MEEAGAIDSSILSYEDVVEWLKGLPLGDCESLIILWAAGNTGLRLPAHEMPRLYGELWRAGEEVWICSDTQRWVIELGGNATLRFWSVQPVAREPAWNKMRSRIMYVEVKSGQNDCGAAWIGRVRFSRTGRMLYYRGKRFQSLKGQGNYANYRDVETGDEYWISGCKKNGQDRHWAGGGPVHIDDDVREEYWTRIRRRPADKHQRVI